MRVPPLLCGQHRDIRIRITVVVVGGVQTVDNCRNPPPARRSAIFQLCTVLVRAVHSFAFFRKKSVLGAKLTVQKAKLCAKLSLVKIILNVADKTAQLDVIFHIVLNF